jgi:hypothetical protein
MRDPATTRSRPQPSPVLNLRTNPSRIPPLRNKVCDKDGPSQFNPAT